MSGCGIIIYYMEEPFEEYKYNKLTKQWKEMFREHGREWWIESMELTSASAALFTVEEADVLNGGKYLLQIADLGFARCL